jgi:uncharacterized integral membrane protein
VAAPHRAPLTTRGDGYDTVMSETSPDQDASPPPPTDTPAQDPLRGSRTSAAWIAVVGLALLLLVLVVFVGQNTQDVQVSFLTWEGQAPLAVALLVAALVGIALAVAAGSLRILQVRRRVRRVRG